MYILLVRRPHSLVTLMGQSIGYQNGPSGSRQARWFILLSSGPARESQREESSARLDLWSDDGEPGEVPRARKRRPLRYRPHLPVNRGQPRQRTNGTGFFLLRSTEVLSAVSEGAATGQACQLRLSRSTKALNPKILRREVSEQHGLPFFRRFLALPQGPSSDDAAMNPL